MTKRGPAQRSGSKGASFLYAKLLFLSCLAGLCACAGMESTENSAGGEDVTTASGASIGEDSSAGGSLVGSGGVGAASAGSQPGGGAAGSGGVPSDPFEAVLGESYDELPLFDGTPPSFRSNAPDETVDSYGQVGNVSVPSLRRYPFKRSAKPARTYLVFPGGAYYILNFRAHADDLAEQLGPEGIAVFALKYRVGEGAIDAPSAALLDAKRAVRLIRQNAERFGIDPDNVGVIGYSAGSHLALRLVETADEGNPTSADPVERRSARPSFVGSMMTWAFRASDSPFNFPATLPPAFFCHAENDGEAPIALTRAVANQFEARDAAVFRDFYPMGSHEVCHVGDANAPGKLWPARMDAFLSSNLKYP